MTTTNLHAPRRHWFDLPVPAAAGIIIFAIYLIVGLVWQLRSAPGAVAVPTPALPVIALATSAPIIVIQKETPPTPAPPTPDQQVYQELEQLRARVVDLEAQQAAAPPIVEQQPVIVYQPAAPLEMAVATPEPDQYAVTNADPNFYSPPNTSIEDRQKLIGSDPNALACGGSPMCGGMTNREAQAALDAERAAQR